MVSQEFIRHIFYSGQFGFGGDREITDKITFLINNKYLLFSPIVLCSKKQYLELCSNKKIQHGRDEASGGGASHVALKLIGERYIKNEYGLKSKFEQPFAGFIPDVQSIDGQIICECGHTNNPEKIFSYFKYPEVRYVIQIPYPLDEDINIVGYEFQSQPYLHSFLELESEEKLQQIKDILNRR